jgi:SAM-dependent methyltransferase
VLQTGDIHNVLMSARALNFAEAFERRGLAVAGVDVNPEMVAAAFEQVPNGDFRESLAEALPFRDQSYDLVFFGLVFHETDEPLKALQEAQRVCQRRAAILEWPYQSQEFGPLLEHRLKPENIRELAERAGFRPVQTIQLTNLVLYLFDR